MLALRSSKCTSDAVINNSARFFHSNLQGNGSKAGGRTEHLAQRAQVAGNEPHREDWDFRGQISKLGSLSSSIPDDDKFFRSMRVAFSWKDGEGCSGRGFPLLFFFSFSFPFLFLFGSRKKSTIVSVTGCLHVAGLPCFKPADDNRLWTPSGDENEREREREGGGGRELKRDFSSALVSLQANRRTSEK
ncbi:hypothetical protein F4809DRAFT_348616 [Biscogniauxia mediterranea]|nr:hypothetical protein F4809DRAFT_348616 [Biscogniauxia mediterranea]